MPSTEYILLARAGWLLIALDLANWFYWISITASNVQKGDHALDNVYNLRAAAGFLALAAPHTVLIPTLGAILSDLNKHCSQGQCQTLETPSWQWYIFAFLVLPFDCLTLAYNIKVFADDKGIATASAWAAADTILIAGWVVISLVVVHQRHSDAATARAVLGSMVAKKIKARYGAVGFA